ncbi:MAG: hypothetical protein K8F91_00270, partial [Candidatus Obscuribacterales bacterium]|nr:hypothetical protein [Candidatus Obscuribacterales bacterium]
MRNRIFGWAMLPTMLLLLALAGCKPEADNTPPQVPAGPVYDIKVESRPDTTDEFQRLHYFLKDGTKVKLEIQYRDGRTEQFNYRPDGTVEEQLVLHIHSKKVKSLTKFAADGKT